MCYRRRMELNDYLSLQHHASKNKTAGKEYALEMEYAHLSDIFGTDNSGNPIILSSLHKVDELRRGVKTSSIKRQPGANLDGVTTPDGEYFQCHINTLLDFTHGDGKAYKHAFEAAAAIALAAQHLNDGIGWIVPELAGLHERCPIRFSTEFVDTEYDQGTSLGHVIEMTDRVPGKDRVPCAFIGATRSSVSIPTAIVTGIRGYPQVSSQSTSEQLDDLGQFPLFSRTVPSDVDNAIPIVKFFHDKLKAKTLSVLHVNNEYGNAFADDLKLAAQKHAPDLEIVEHELAEHPNPKLIKDSIKLIKKTKFTYVFAVLFDDVIDDVMIEAYHQGVAGDGIHNWFFSNSFSDIDDRHFEKGSPLHMAYKGVGRMEVSGGHPGMRSFDTFACNLRTLKSSPPDLRYLASLMPKKNYSNYEGEAAPFLFDEKFMDPVPKMADRTSPAYEAAIAIGLSACNAVMDGLPLTGANHHRYLINSNFTGVESDVWFSNETGTRDPQTTLFAIENEVEHEIVVDGKTMIQFHSTISDIYKAGEWEHLEDYIFNDGTNVIPHYLTPPEDVVHHYIHTPLKIVAYSMCMIVFVLAFRFLYWTHKNRDKHVVKASQPVFLNFLCIGAIIFASTIIPLNIDDRVASIEGCTIACNFDTWFLFLGFAVMFSALFTKIYRVNKIMNSPQKYKRIKVTISDVAKPMAGIIGVNMIVLTVMTAIHPSHWEIVEQKWDIHGRPTETYGHCTMDTQVPYYIALGSLDFAALCFALHQAWQTRKLATEFSESRYIFYALLGIMVALFQGLPVLFLVQDSPDTQDFIKCTIIFVTCCSVLCFMFYPKQKYLIKQSKLKSMPKITKVSGFDDGISQRSLNGNTELCDIPGLSSVSTNSGGSGGVKIIHKTANELTDENKLIRLRLLKLGINLGSLASEQSGGSQISEESDGVRIEAQKSQMTLLHENKELRRALNQAINTKSNGVSRKNEYQDLNNSKTIDHFDSVMGPLESVVESEFEGWGKNESSHEQEKAFVGDCKKVSFQLEDDEDVEQREETEVNA